MECYKWNPECCTYESDCIRIPSLPIKKEFLGMKLAVVGSRLDYWKPSDIPLVKIVIASAVTFLEPSEIVSGASPKGGVDTWAEEEALERELLIKTFPAAAYTREAFEARNKQIAEYCDKLLCISSKSAKTHGGLWTYRYALFLGRKAWRVDI